MIKFFVTLLATTLLCFVASLYWPWWSIAVVASLIACLLPLKPWENFLSGFLGVFLLWIGLTWWIDRANGGMLSARMAQVLPVGGKVIYLHLLTAFVGGLVGGLAALSGNCIRSLFYTTKN